MKIELLKPLEANPFKSKGDEQIKAIASSIETFGKMMEIRKIVIDEKNSILGGNKRYFACKTLGMKDIPDNWIEQRTDLTEAEKREFIVKDNAHWGSEWDYEMLKDWDVPAEEWGVDVPEWDDYSDKNQEIDFGNLSDEMMIKLVYPESEYEQVKEQLSKIAATPEQAVWKLLGNE